MCGPKLHGFLENSCILRKKGVLWSRSNQKIKLAPVSPCPPATSLKNSYRYYLLVFFQLCILCIFLYPMLVTTFVLSLTLHLFIPFFSPTLSIFTGFIAASSDLSCFRSHNSTHACFLSPFPDFSQSISLPLFLPYFSVPDHVVPKWRPFLLFLCYPWLSNFQLKNR